MAYKLFNIGKAGAIAIFFILINTLDSSSTEYVFTAPPEVDHNIEEIPESESEYPLYECDNESGTEGNDVLDSHDCTCTDCEELTESDLQPQQESTNETDAE